MDLLAVMKEEEIVVAILITEVISIEMTEVYLIEIKIVVDFCFLI